MTEEVKKTVKKKKSVDPKKKRNRKINTILMTVILLMSIMVAIAFIINMIRVGTVKTGEGTTETLTVDTGKSMKNDLYTIGNNPTDYEKECFQKLTDTIGSGTKEELAEAVVYNFVSDYFTWTNKDGNYEVGGLQYIFGTKYTAFEEWSLWNYYEDLDLYISQYGRENLAKVESITTDTATFKTNDFTVLTMDPQQTFDCYQVQVSWKYASCGIDTSLLPNSMRFQVVDNDGRMEIVEFYDMASVTAWEAANLKSADTQNEQGGTE